MTYPLVLDLADDNIPVAVTCRGAGLLQAGLPLVEGQPVSDGDYDDAHLINAAVDMDHDDPEFGDRFTTDEPSALAVDALHNAVLLRGRPAATIVLPNPGDETSGCRRCTTGKCGRKRRQEIRHRQRSDKAIGSPNMSSV